MATDTEDIFGPLPIPLGGGTILAKRMLTTKDQATIDATQRALSRSIAEYSQWSEDLRDAGRKVETDEDIKKLDAFTEQQRVAHVTLLRTILWKGGEDIQPPIEDWTLTFLRNTYQLTHATIVTEFTKELAATFPPNGSAA